MAGVSSNLRTWWDYIYIEPYSPFYVDTTDITEASCTPLKFPEFFAFFLTPSSDIDGGKN